MTYTDFERFHKTQIGYLQIGDYDTGFKDFLNLLTEVIDEKESDINILNGISGLAVDYGYHTKNPSLIEQGVNIMELVANNRPEVKEHWEYHYNLANGYMNMYQIEQSKQGDKFNIFLSDEYLIKAKQSFEEALSKTNTSDVWINFGNLYEELGRKFDALDCYLKGKNGKIMDPMAMGNVGIAIRHLSDISRTLRAELKIFAQNYIEQSLQYPKEIINKGGNLALQTFTKENDALKIELVYAGILGKKIKRNPVKRYWFKPFYNFFTKYCLDNELYLNGWVFDKNSQKAIYDDLYISMILPVDDTETYYRLSKKLNEIIEAYIAARTNLVASHYKSKELTLLNELTTYVNPLDYSVSNNYNGILKTSFKECFNILDKIAIFLDDYLNLGAPKNNISYHTFWFKGQDA
ncbi:MAG TPA: LA2681 family HEPN domain-containing protein, partial [Candidatus Dojkabacteria bacterium]|nr:LA2681 family HEPN domain-containing protein [Candidatus Dojkabacteria bacterium]